MALGEAQAGAAVNPWAGQITRSGRVGRRAACTQWRSHPTDGPGHRQCRQQGHLVVRTLPTRHDPVAPSNLSDHRQRFGGVHLVTLSRSDVVPDGCPEPPPASVGRSHARRGRHRNLPADFISELVAASRLPPNRSTSPACSHRIARRRLGPGTYRPPPGYR